MAAGALDRVESFGEAVPTAWKLCVQVRVKDPGVPIKELARMLGYAPTTVYLWTKNPKYQRYEDYVVRQVQSAVPERVDKGRTEVAKSVAERFLTHAEEMQDRLLAILDTVDDPKLQASIAEGWLDRAGFAVPKGKQERAFAVVISDDMMQTFLDRAREASLLPAIDGEVIDSHA